MREVYEAGRPEGVARRAWARQALARQMQRTGTMETAQAAERRIMQPRMKIWLERQDKLALSDYRLRLLRAVAETGSLASAAEELGLSYRRAWGKVREIEQNLGYKLIESSAGGAGGGGSELTPEGVALLDRYDRFAHESRAIVARLYDEIFSPETPTKPASVRSDRGGPR